MIEKNTILVPFSGGLDSTYMIYKLILDGEKVCPVYFELRNTKQNKSPQLEPRKLNRSKSFIEKQQAELIVSMLIKQFGNKIIPLSTVTIPFIESQQSQWSSWFNGVKEILKKYSFNKVAFGWNQSDIHDEKDSIMFEKRQIDFIKETNAKIILPVFHLTKIDINELLPIQYRNETMSCELPIYVKENKSYICIQCGKCRTCKLQKMINIFTDKKYIITKEITDEQASTYNIDHVNLLPVYGSEVKKPIHMINN